MANVRDISSIKVVVIDDSAIMRDAVGSMLAAFGFQDIKTYANGIFSAREIPKNFADLVICDYLMEPVNGIEVLKQFRASKFPEIAEVPFILMSAFRDVETIANAFFAKGTEFLLKPFTQETFLTRICAALNCHDQFVLTDSMDGKSPNTSFDIHKHLGTKKPPAAQDKSPPSNIIPSLNQLMKAELNLNTLMVSYNKLVFEEIIEMESEVDSIRRDIAKRPSLDSLIFKAHDIKGSAMMFGNEQMGKLAGELTRLMQNAFHQGAPATLNDPKLIDHVERYMAQIKTIAAGYN